MNTLEGLNKEQKEAVTFGEGPLLIVAGAGTGKTTVITRRVAYLIESQKAKSDEILALTFTDKAAQEMIERVDQLLPLGYLDLWISTFHSFGERVLQENALEIGLSPNFKLLNEIDQVLLIRENFDHFPLKYYKPLGNPTRFIQALVKVFSRAKDENVSFEEYLNYAQKLEKKAQKSSDPALEEEAKKVKEVAQAYKVYQKLLWEKGFLDFGDLIIYTLKLFKERPSILEKYRRQFKFILVDEFQDTNYAQYELIKLLAAPKNNLTVVSDDDQAIYRWRGASFNNVIQFKKDFPQSRVIILTQNYRNKQNIIDLAYQFIQLNNPDRLEYQLQKENQNLGIPVTKRLKSTKEGKGIIEFIPAKSQEEEVFKVMKKIEEIKAKNKEVSWSDFAILVRANHQAEIYTQMLESYDWPYEFVAHKGLYEKPEIMDIISYLKLLDNYHESPALFRVLNLPFWKIEEKEIMHLLHYARKKSISLYEALEKAEKIKPSLKPITLNKLNYILDLIQKHTKLAKIKSVSQVVYAFLTDSGYLKYLTQKDKLAENAVKINNIQYFFNKVQEFERTSSDKSLKAYMQELNLILETGEGGELPEQPWEESPEAIKIMTIHSAKGLEFRYVFLVQLVDRRFPTIERREPIEFPKELLKEILPQGDIHLQEERRLFYVGMTRAKDGLFFTAAENYGGKMKKRPSRFLYELGIIKKDKEISTKSFSYQDIKPTFKEKPQIKKNLQETLPPHFSFSQFKAFEICPKQYRYAFLLKIPVVGKSTFSFGKSIHNTLKDFYKLLKERAGKTKERIIKKDLVTLEELLDLYEKNWIDDWYESQKHMQERKKVGKKALIDYFNKNKSKWRIPEFVEKEFHLKINSHTLYGVIDRIDILEDKDKPTVEIIDYKTGLLPQEEKKVEQDQLLIYALAAKEVFKFEPKLLTYEFLEEGKRISITPTDQDINKIKEKILKTINQISQSDFKATPNEWKCKHCDFRDICEDKIL